MGTSDLLFHLAGFLAPAIFLALALPLATWLLLRTSRGRMPFWGQAALVFAGGSAVLAAGLWWFGHDGKMATYAAMVAVGGTLQWVAVRGWR